MGCSCAIVTRLTGKIEMARRRQLHGNTDNKTTGWESWNGCASRVRLLLLNTMCHQDSRWRSSDDEEGEEEKTIWSTAEGDGDADSSDGQAGWFLPPPLLLHHLFLHPLLSLVPLMRI